MMSIGAMRPTPAFSQRSTKGHPPQCRQSVSSPSESILTLASFFVPARRRQEFVGEKTASVENTPVARDVRMIRVLPILDEEIRAVCTQVSFLNSASVAQGA